MLLVPIFSCRLGISGTFATLAAQGGETFEPYHTTEFGEISFIEADTVIGFFQTRKMVMASKTGR